MQLQLADTGVSFVSTCTIGQFESIRKSTSSHTKMHQPYRHQTGHANTAVRDNTPGITGAEGGGRKRGDRGGIGLVKKKSVQRKSLSIRGVVWICYAVAIIKRDKLSVQREGINAFWPP